MVAKPVTVGVVGVIVLASALVLNYFVLPGEETESAPEAVAPAAPTPAGKPAPAADAADASPAGTAQAPATPPAVKAGPVRPSFDVVRVDPDGNTVIAGRGAPNSEIAILDGDREIGRVTSDNRGEWVFVPPSKLDPGQRLLTLKELKDSPTESSEAVVLVIPEKGKDIAGRASGDAGVPLALVVPREGAAAGDQAVAARVLQAPAAGPLASSSAQAAPEPSAADRSAPATAGTPPTAGSSTGQVAAAPAAQAPAAQVPGSQVSGPRVSETQAPGAQASAGGKTAAGEPSGGTASSPGTTAGTAAAGGVRAGDTASTGAPETNQASAAPAPSSGGSAAPAAPSAPAAGSQPSPQVASAAPTVSAYPEAAGPSGGDKKKEEVAVDIIDYDAKGDVVFSGRADPGSRVEVFIDNQKVGHTGADAEGRWTMRPAEPVAPGSYQLRVDKVAPSGTVEARVAFPFVRADPLTELPNNRLVVIQPGNNLWRIATRIYGAGTRYVEIFDANKDQILDPDLIYPGQVFGLPRVN